MHEVVSSLADLGQAENQGQSMTILVNLKGIQWESVLFGKTRLTIFWMSSVLRRTWFSMALGGGLECNVKFKVCVHTLTIAVGMCHMQGQ